MPGPVVLVACATASVRGLVARELRGAGHPVAEAATPAEVLDEARRARPGVLVVEVSHDVPGLLAAVRAEPALRDVPVVALTSGTPTEALDAGADDVVALPFDPAVLAARVRAAARTAALRDELRRRADELEAFASRASHDLRSPLTVIAGVARTLAQRWDRLDPAGRTRLLCNVAEAAERAAAMAADLVVLARAGTGSLQDPWAWADAAEVARRVAAGADLPDDAVRGSWEPVRMDAGALAAVLTELTGNALVHGAPPVTITATPAPEGLHVVVRDRGPGVDPRIRATAFEPFVRGPTVPRRDATGTGIGLAVVRRTVERWGGTVSFDPVEGGTAVRLVLPLARDAAPYR